MKSIYTILFLTSALLTTSHAAILSYYDIEVDGSNAVTTAETGLTASNFDASDASGDSGNFTWVGSKVIYFFDADLGNGTDPLVSDIVATWSLTPDAGNMIDIGTTGAIDIGLLAYGSKSLTGTYSVHARVYVSDVSDFSNLLATSTIGSDVDIGDDDNGNNSVHTDVSLNLDSAISSDSTLYFGLAFLEDLSSVTSPNNSHNARYDGITVNGVVSPVPEPSSLVVLLGISGLMIAARRRRS